jgi:nucleoside-diphosphate-sugar epimerase
MSMRRPVLLITGANGEIGHGLIERFARRGDREIVALDLNPIDPAIAKRCAATMIGDILDDGLLQRLISEFEIHEVYHLAALLSTRAEFVPIRAHRVNVEGTLNLLQLAHEQARSHGNAVKFVFPSSIAAYGLPDRATKDAQDAVKVGEFGTPSTMYGCNKLSCEQLGIYYTFHYRQLAPDRAPSGVDFRCVRLPGVISATTLPSGGTSDYAPEMLHAAAEGDPYLCFVDEQACIPFMTMPDAIKALTGLAGAPVERLTQRVYNVAAFSLTAGQLRDRVQEAFPRARITFAPDGKRSRIVDSWPARVDDAPARADWGWRPDHDAHRAFEEYLVPTLRR